MEMRGNIGKEKARLAEKFHGDLERGLSEKERLMRVALIGHFVKTNPLFSWAAKDLCGWSQQIR